MKAEYDSHYALSQRVQQRGKKNPEVKGWKGRKEGLFSDDTFLYIENPQESTEHLLETGEVSNLADTRLIYKRQLYSVCQQQKKKKKQT